MPLLRIHPGRLETIPSTTFAAERLGERADIQRLLRSHIEVLDSHLLVIAEEFGDWEDSRRRIDLLAIDRDRNLVVIELKRDRPPDYASSAESTMLRGSRRWLARWLFTAISEIPKCSAASSNASGNSSLPR
jgi:hypothetical protein